MPFIWAHRLMVSHDGSLWMVLQNTARLNARNESGASVSKTPVESIITARLEQRVSTMHSRTGSRIPSLRLSACTLSIGKMVYLAAHYSSPVAAFHVNRIQLRS